MNIRIAYVENAVRRGLASEGAFAFALIAILVAVLDGGVGFGVTDGGLGAFAIPLAIASVIVAIIAVGAAYAGRDRAIAEADATYDRAAQARGRGRVPSAISAAVVSVGSLVVILYGRP